MVARVWAENLPLGLAIATARPLYAITARWFQDLLMQARSDTLIRFRRGLIVLVGPPAVP